MAAGLSCAEVARELHRSEDWLRRHHAKLHREQGFPKPLLSGGELVWDCLHLQAWKDAKLPPSLKRTVRILRLAEAAIVATAGGIPSDVAASELRLSQKLGLITEEEGA